MIFWGKILIFLATFNFNLWSHWTATTRWRHQGGKRARAVGLELLTRRCSSDFKDRLLNVDSSVTRLHGLWKFLAANFLIKVAQLLDIFWGSFKVCHFIRKNYFGYFWGQVLEICVTFESPAGHTGRQWNPHLPTKLKPFKYGPTTASFLFSSVQFKPYFIPIYLESLKAEHWWCTVSGFEPGAPRWWAQTMVAHKLSLRKKKIWNVVINGLLPASHS